jgi:hypothetical protein
LSPEERDEIKQINKTQREPMRALKKRENDPNQPSQKPSE